MIVILWMIDSEERRLNLSHHSEPIEERNNKGWQNTQVLLQKMEN